MRDGLSKRRSEIERLIEKVRPFLSDGDTFDVLVNPPRGVERECRVWVDSAGGGLVDTGVRMSTVEVENLNRSIASELGRFIDDEHPILKGELPWNGARVTALHYPITRTGPSLDLRIPSSRLFTLDDYASSGELDGPAPARRSRPAPPKRGHRAAIEYAVEYGLNGLIGGAPQSGKTTLLNAVQLFTRQRKPNRRLYVVEDLES